MWGSCCQACRGALQRLCVLRLLSGPCLRVGSAGAWQGPADADTRRGHLACELMHAVSMHNPGCTAVTGPVQRYSICKAAAGSEATSGATGLNSLTAGTGIIFVPNCAPPCPATDSRRLTPSRINMLALQVRTQTTHWLPPPQVSSARTTTARWPQTSLQRSSDWLRCSLICLCTLGATAWAQRWPTCVPWTCATTPT